MSMTLTRSDDAFWHVRKLPMALQVIVNFEADILSVPALVLGMRHTNEVQSVT